MVRKTLIYAVQARIDELTPFEGLAIPIDGSNDKPVDMLIDSLLDEAARDVLTKVPLSTILLSQCSNIAYALEDGSGYVVLPPDFLRLARFRMKGWRRDVTKAVEVTDPVYVMQFNEFDRGGVAKPVAVLASHEGEAVLQYFSLPPGREHQVEVFEYVPALPAEKVGERLTDIVVWTCVAKVLQITGNPLAEMAYKTVMDLLIHGNYGNR